MFDAAQKDTLLRVMKPLFGMEAEFHEADKNFVQAAKWGRDTSAKSKTTKGGTGAFGFAPGDQVVLDGLSESQKGFEGVDATVVSFGPTGSGGRYTVMPKTGLGMPTRPLTLSPAQLIRKATREGKPAPDCEWLYGSPLGNLALPVNADAEAGLTLMDPRTLIATSNKWRSMFLSNHGSNRPALNIDGEEKCKLELVTAPFDATPTVAPSASATAQVGDAGSLERDWPEAGAAMERERPVGMLRRVPRETDVTLDHFICSAVAILRARNAAATPGTSLQEIAEAMTKEDPSENGEAPRRSGAFNVPVMVKPAMAKPVMVKPAMPAIVQTSGRLEREWPLPTTSEPAEREDEEDRSMCDMPLRVALRNDVAGKLLLTPIAYLSFQLNFAVPITIFDPRWVVERRRSAARLPKAMQYLDRTATPLKWLSRKSASADLDLLLSLDCPLVRSLTALLREIHHANGRPGHGARLVDVPRTSAFARAEDEVGQPAPVLAGSVILAVDDELVADDKECFALLKAAPDGAQVKLTIKGKDSDLTRLIPKPVAGDKWMMVANTLGVHHGVKNRYALMPKHAFCRSGAHNALDPHAANKEAAARFEVYRRAAAAYVRLFKADLPINACNVRGRGALEPFQHAGMLYVLVETRSPAGSNLMETINHLELAPGKVPRRAAASSRKPAPAISPHDSLFRDDHHHPWPRPVAHPPRQFTFSRLYEFASKVRTIQDASQTREAATPAAGKHRDKPKPRCATKQERCGVDGEGQCLPPSKCKAVGGKRLPAETARCHLRMAICCVVPEGSEICAAGDNRLGGDGTAADLRGEEVRILVGDDLGQGTQTDVDVEDVTTEGDVAVQEGDDAHAAAMRARLCTQPGEQSTELASRCAEWRRQLSTTRLEAFLESMSARHAAEERIRLEVGPPSPGTRSRRSSAAQEAVQFIGQRQAEALAAKDREERRAAHERLAREEAERAAAIQQQIEEGLLEEEERARQDAYRESHTAVAVAPTRRGKGSIRRLFSLRNSLRKGRRRSRRAAGGSSLVRGEDGLVLGLTEPSEPDAITASGQEPGRVTML